MDKAEALDQAIDHYQRLFDSFMEIDAEDVDVLGHSIGMASQAERTITPVIEALKEFRSE